MGAGLAGKIGKDLLEKLMAALAEASPLDQIWGINALRRKLARPTSQKPAAPQRSSGED